MRRDATPMALRTRAGQDQMDSGSVRLPYGRTAVPGGGFQVAKISGQVGTPPVSAVAISFIVIARNQVRTLGMCLESVKRAARTACLSSFEIIYVDSASTDGSIALVQSLQGSDVRIISVTGVRNAAIARNVGASVSRGRVLFFVDGDMEVDPGFLGDVLDSTHRLRHAVVTGQLPEKLYDASGRFIADAPDRYRITHDGYRPDLGGVFLIERQWFDELQGFSSELRCNEDLDFGLRLARCGGPAFGLARPIAVHHTIEYADWSRILPMIGDGSLFYPSVIFRRHLANRHYLPVLMSSQRPTLILLLSLLLAVLIHPFWIAGFIGYVIAKNLRRPHASFLQDLFTTTARSVCFLVGLVAFFPKPIPRGSVVYSAVGLVPGTTGSAPVQAPPATHGCSGSSPPPTTTP